MPAALLFGLLLVLVVGSRGETAVAASPGGAPESPPEQRFTMFTLTGTGASLEPTGGENSYVLTIQGVSPTIVWFEDRPARGAGTTPTADFLSKFPLSPHNPANAALVASFSANRSEDSVIVVAVSSPAYDPEEAVLRLNATVLYIDLQDMKIVHNYVAHASRSGPEQDLTTATSAALFIDSCPDFNSHCETNCMAGGEPIVIKECGDINWGMCWVCAYCYPCSWEAANGPNDCPWPSVSLNPDFTFAADACANGWLNTPWDEPNGLPVVTEWDPTCAAEIKKCTSEWSFNANPQYSEI